MIKAIEEIVTDCFAEVQAELVEEVDRVIESENEFADLGFVGQDIIDTGRLLNSKLIFATTMGLRIYWDARSPDNGFYYPAAIIQGFFAWGGNKFVQGRNFPVRALQNVDPVESLAEKLRAKGLKVRVKSNMIGLL